MRITETELILQGKEGEWLIAENGLITNEWQVSMVDRKITGKQAEKWCDDSEGTQEGGVHKTDNNRQHRTHPDSTCPLWATAEEETDYTEGKQDGGIHKRDNNRQYKHILSLYVYQNNNFLDS